MGTEVKESQPNLADALSAKVDDKASGKEFDNKGKTFSGRIVKSILGDDRFAITDEGVYCVDVVKGEIKPEMLICTPLKIVADTRDVNNENWGRILEFEDKDGNPQSYYMRMQDLKRDGDEIVDGLLYRGLTISPGKKAQLRLVEYIQNSAAENGMKARSTDQTGWHDSRFVLPKEVIGAGSEIVIYQGRQTAFDAYAHEGSVGEWQENISRFCVGNSRLVFAISICFAAPLLKLIGDESGGFNFVGNSSTGKSTALIVAASVMGNPRHYNQSWRATSNGLEGIAKYHNDTCLMLDELSQVQPKEAGEVAYMLANGSGKLRANIRGEARQKTNWRLLFLSSGEITLGEHMLEGGKKAKAGQEIRMVDIQADAGKGMGLFEELHGIEGGAEFSDTLKLNSSRYHGSALRAYITNLISEIEVVGDWLNRTRDEFLAECLSKEANGQVQRVAGRFALIAAAGELATIYGITGWQGGEATKAAKACFESWLDLRGGTGAQESKSLLDQLKGFLERHGDSRFVEVVQDVGIRLVDNKKIVQNRAGFRLTNKEGQTVFLILPEAFREICTGYNVKAATKILIEAGILKPAGDGKSQKCYRLPGMGVTRVYHISGNVWEEMKTEDS